RQPWMQPFARPMLATRYTTAQQGSFYSMDGISFTVFPRRSRRVAVEGDEGSCPTTPLWRGTARWSWRDRAADLPGLLQELHERMEGLVDRGGDLFRVEGLHAEQDDCRVARGGHRSGGPDF